MNRALPARFVVPKLAHGWLLIALRAGEAWAVESPASAPITVA